MPILDVKITDLDQVSSLHPDDLFLIADPQYDTSGQPIPNKYYVSNSIAGDGLSSFLKECLIREDLSVIGEWTISNLNMPRRFSYERFLEILSDENDLSQMLEMLPGKYESSELNTLSGRELSDSLSVNYCYVPNLDYVHRLVGYLYQDNERKRKWMPSYVGEIVHNIYPDISTMLSIYGPETMWTRISQARAYDLSGTTIDIRLANNGNTDHNERDYRNFKIDIPLTSNEFISREIDGITNTGTINGITDVHQKLRNINSITFSLSVVGNTQHPGQFSFSFYNGNNTKIKSYPTTGLMNFQAAESLTAIDDFGYEAETGRPANSETKWWFIEQGTRPGKGPYGGYFRALNQRMNLEGSATKNAYFRFEGHTGYSTANYPYRCRAFIRVTQIVGTVNGAFNEDDGIYTWQRIQ